ncbi:MAG: hypothetical protein LBT74_12405 [Acidobacteriota bacterium]|nr:hypothetical protein [Acidobacteriota bacterium]
MLVVMFMLGLVSILGLVLTMRATTEARIGDNSESHMRAVYAALSGLEHARMLARGIEFDAWLRGPDGVCDNTPAYRAEARRFSFRLPVPVATAQRLDIAAPLADLGATSDDGVPNTGLFSGSPGTELIPRLGIAQWAGPFPASRYFVKVADNNGEASELAGDAGDDPFSDGDGIVIVRAVGVAGTFAEQVGANIRRNSVAVYESRLKRAATWNLGAAMTVVGPAAAASFTGTPEIAGGDAVGIGVLDTAPDDGASPEAALRAAAASGGTVSGGGLSEPSVRDLTAAARADRDKAWLLDASRLQGFATRDAPQAADRVYDGGQLWTASSTPPLGAYDKDLPWNAPSQAPRVTLVRGDLAAPDGLSGAGVLVVTGGLECAGTLDWRGLILVLGEGRLSLDAGGPGVAGGLVVGKLTGTGAGAAFGAPEIEIGGATKVTADRELVRMALRLFPVERVGFREIAGIDP